MALNFTSDLMTLYNAKIAADANYQVPGNFGLTGTLSGALGVASVTIDTRGTYTVVPTATAATGTATFTTRMRLRAASTIAGAGTGYTVNDVLTLVGGTNTAVATITVSTIGGGGDVTAFTLTTAGVYTALPANPISVTGGTGTGFTLTGSWEVDSLVVTSAGSYAGAAPTINFSSGAAAATAVLATPTDDQDNEKKLLFLIETIRSLVAEADDVQQLKDMHTVISKMLAAIKHGGRSTFSASTIATAVLNAGMHYVSKSPRRVDVLT